ncbi:hypothetical protein HRI_003042000 [Hibiscus trionum]|uniref:Uncharacterized protein n=1 Tax=Hibiscus trionum TaxID=183268 RepID=A0A9W7MAR5_HIBTR|nr:hypothetical protein HRI_003042000 [Hibiscus trionum]
MTPFKALYGRDPPVLRDYLDCAEAVSGPALTAGYTTAATYGGDARQTADENLEDKVVSDGEGVVMDEPDAYQETHDAGKDHVMGEETTLSHACREEQEPMEEEHVAPRRSTRVRRHPANLTDFVLS